MWTNQIIYRVRVYPIKKWDSKKDWHKYYLIKTTDGKNLHVAESLTEAIKKVEDEGWILEPD